MPLTIHEAKTQLSKLIAAADPLHPDHLTNEDHDQGA
jgi:hypothetical protein